jgi:7-cyano-7-deazaguanine synthase
MDAVSTASAVLFSGGLDSAVLLAAEMRGGHRARPIHVRAGLAWEDAEARAIRRLLASPPFEGLASPLMTLTMDMRDLVLGPLGGNPFPDATPEFFAAMAQAMSLGLAHPISIAAPFASLHKEDVIRLGRDLGVRMELSLSCMNPDDDRHCGLCSKCRERRDAFAAAGVEDKTEYAAESPR